MVLIGLFPPEVWLNIISYIPNEDLGNIRQTCTDLNKLCKNERFWEKVSCLT
jgi:hypothetical protein